MNESIKALNEAVLSVSKVYAIGPAHSNDILDQSGMFLSQTDLAPFFKVEEAFTQELTKYTKRLFFDVSTYFVSAE